MNELNEKIEALTLEVRSIADEMLDASKDVNEVRSRLDAKKAELREAKQALAQMQMPKDNHEERKLAFDKDEWLNAAKEKRSITIGNTGSILQVKSLVKELKDNDNILSKARFFYGANAATNIPVLAPLSDPSDYAEGATNVAVDTDAGVAVTSITPKAYSVVLPITAEMLTMGSVNLEAELPSIFNDAFRKVMHKAMVKGLAATKTTGFFTVAATSSSGANVTNIAGTSITIKELVNLALTVASKDEEFEIVVSPKVYSNILSDSTAGEDIKLYKEEIIRNKTIEGVKITIDSACPDTNASGDVLAVAMPLNRYAIGVAGEMTIDPIKVKGDTNTYFQATMFFGGCPICNKDIYALAVA